MKKIFFAVVAVLFLSGCAGAKQYLPLPDLTVPVENPDYGRIYVLRPTPFGSAVSMKVREGIKNIGVTGPNSFLAWEREPGPASIVSKAENDEVLNFEVEKGKAYYVQQHVRMGLMEARNELELLSEDEGKALLSKCKAPKVELQER